MNHFFDFAFEFVSLLSYKCHKISFNSGGLYIDSPNWIKSIKYAINPKNNDDKYFEYAVATALNHEKTWERFIKSLLQINITGKGKIFQQKRRTAKSFKKNNPTTPSNNLIAQSNKEEIKQA